LCQKATITFVMSICLSECISAALTGQISIKLGTGDFNEKSVKKIPNLIKIGQKYGHFT